MAKMKIGYPCINRSIGCTANSTFRIASYSEGHLIEKVENNLNCLKKILKYNKEKRLLFFRISSDLVPFASHPVCRFNWQKHFKPTFKEIGEYIKDNDFRISMHPDQFVLINAEKKEIVERSIKELKYHNEILDLMKLKQDAKIQIHVGGIYKDKEKAKNRFTENYKKLPEKIRKRLVIENEERLYNLKDCLELSKITGVPVLFDFFHHECYNNKESFEKAVQQASQTWKKQDGIIMTDYSSQAPGEKTGKHTQHINPSHFEKTMKQVKNQNFDLMLEIKDKEKSAVEARKILKQLKFKI
jgi:UV DNA damage endonuclease